MFNMEKDTEMDFWNNTHGKTLRHFITTLKAKDIVVLVDDNKWAYVKDIETVHPEYMDKIISIVDVHGNKYYCFFEN